MYFMIMPLYSFFSALSYTLTQLYKLCSYILTSYQLSKDTKSHLKSLNPEKPHRPLLKPLEHHQSQGGDFQGWLKNTSFSYHFGPCYIYVSYQIICSYIIPKKDLKGQKLAESVSFLFGAALFTLNFGKIHVCQSN